MSTMSFGFVVDGQATTGTEITNLFRIPETIINDMDAESPRRGAFQEAHHGSLIKLGGASTPYVVGWQGQHTYSYTTFGAAVSYTPNTSFGADGSTDRTTIGDPLATGGYVGAGGPPIAVGPFSNGIALGMQSHVTYEDVLGILISLNVEVFTYELGNADTIMFCLQFQTTSSPFWFTIDRSERFISVKDLVHSSGSGVAVDVPIRTFLLQSDLTAKGLATNLPITGIRAMVSIVNGSPGDSVTLRQVSLSAIPVHAKAV